MKIKTGDFIRAHISGNIYKVLDRIDNWSWDYSVICIMLMDNGRVVSKVPCDVFADRLEPTDGLEKLYKIACMKNILEK